jgi:ribosomal protein S18 acetylase RimI-like enzyme
VRAVSAEIAEVVEIEVVEIDAVETHPLRRRVLRDGTASDDVVFDGDELATTFHLGVVLDDTLVGVSTWLERAAPDRPAERAFQLRGMAIEPTLQGGRGLGGALLGAGLERCRTRGATVVWARARDTALGFYERHGFEIVGPGYTDPATGLLHHDIVRPLRR